MILLCGIPSEPPLAMAIEAARQLDVPHVVFNQRHAAHYAIRCVLRDRTLHGSLVIDDIAYPLERFRGIYPRLSDPDELMSSSVTRAHFSHEARNAARSRWVHTILHEWLELTSARVANPAWAMASNGSKPYQAQLIARAGFRTPITLVTNDLDALRAFREQHGEVVYKSASSVRSIVQCLSSRDEGRLRRLRELPTQFQERIIGTNLRVHVVADEVFATEIESTAVDYRYAGQEGEAEPSMTAVALPDELAERCRSLSRMLALPFCGIDLMRTVDGDYYCFEVNPSPAYSCYQQATGQPIAHALVRYLAADGQLSRGEDADHRELDRGRGSSDLPHDQRLASS